MTRHTDELSLDQCFALLGGSHLGRLAFIDSVGVLPMIVPVNYLIHEGSVVFRTGPGAKFAAAVRACPVAFEVDGVDDVERTGWSVVIRGRAEELIDTKDLVHLREQQLQPWAPGTKRHYVRVNANLVTGRAIELDKAPGLWWDPT